MLVRMCDFGLDVIISDLTSLAIAALAHKVNAALMPMGRVLSANVDYHSMGGERFLLKRCLSLRARAHRVRNDCKIALGKAGYWETVIPQMRNSDII